MPSNPAAESRRDRPPNTPALRRGALLLLSLLAAVLGGCSTTETTEPDEAAISILPPLDDSAAERCISLSRVASTRVIDSRNIEFRMQGGKVYINILPNRCPGLRKGQPFMYRTSLNNLCDLDLITVLDTGGFGLRPMGSCGLGRFYPVQGGGVDVILEDDDDG